MQLFSTVHRRRMIVLALVVAGVPCFLLLVLALRVLDQERELRLTREDERRAELASDVAEKLRQQLDRVRLEVSAGLQPHPLPALIAPRHGASIQLPWNPSVPGATIGDKDFRSAIDQGEHHEFASGKPGSAIVAYRRAASLAKTSSEDGYAHLLLARALQQSGDSAAATSYYRQVAAMSPAVRDEHSVPLSLYALSRLVDIDGEGLAPLLKRQMTDLATLSPEALHLLADVASRVGTATESAAVESHLQRTSRGQQLQAAIVSLLPSDRAPGAIDSWVPFGDWFWMVGSAWKDGQELIVALDAADLINALVEENPELEGLSLQPGWVEGLQPAAPALPGVSIGLPNSVTVAAAANSGQGDYLLSALIVVLATSLFAAWLLLRDVRREILHADLRSQFVASVSHELKTPLSAIRMFAESLHMGRPSAPEQQKEYLDVIVNESERLGRLLDNVLEFSKIERGTRRYQARAGDLGEVVRRALHGAAYPLQQKQFNLSVHIDDELPAVALDEDAVEQAVLNLLTNAIKYSGDSREIEVRVEQRPGEVALTITDRGIGIPAGEVERIFEKFYRASNSGNVAGAGLGLAIVGHVAREHEARVELDSRPGVGSRFTLLFPVEAI